MRVEQIIQIKFSQNNEKFNQKKSPNNRIAQQNNYRIIIKKKTNKKVSLRQNLPHTNNYNGQKT